MRTKRQFATWADAERAYRAASSDATVSRIALSDVINGTMEWLPERKPYKVGISRLDSASGGIVVVVRDGTADAFYLKDWTADQLRNLRASMPWPKDLVEEYEALHHLVLLVKSKSQEVNERLLAEASRNG